MNELRKAASDFAIHTKTASMVTPQIQEPQWDVKEIWCSFVLKVPQSLIPLEGFHSGLKMGLARAGALRKKLWDTILYFAAEAGEDFPRGTLSDPKIERNMNKELEVSLDIALSSMPTEAQGDVIDRAIKEVF